jgi:hypothetical protein
MFCSTFFLHCTGRQTSQRPAAEGPELQAPTKVVLLQNLTMLRLTEKIREVLARSPNVILRTERPFHPPQK